MGLGQGGGGAEEEDGGAAEDGNGAAGTGVVLCILLVTPYMPDTVQTEPILIEVTPSPPSFSGQAARVWQREDEGGEDQAAQQGRRRRLELSGQGVWVGV